MLFRRFGRTNLSISAISLGTMRIVDCPMDRAVSTVLAAVNGGINHIETAPAYGSSELRLGRILASELADRRDRLIITTKLSPTLSPCQMRDTLEQSLLRLQVDYVDAIAFHGINLPEHLQAVLDSGLEVVRQAIADGLVRFVGFSTHGALSLLEQAIATDAFDFVNLHYYYFNQRNRAAVELAAQHDMGVFIISPADKGGMLYNPPDRLIELCQPMSPLEFGYRWLLEHSQVHTFSLGASQPQDLDVALNVVNQPEPWCNRGAVIANRLEEYEKTMLGGNRCAQCFKCLPCPESINIPEVLRLRNLTTAFDMNGYAQYRYNMFEQAGHWFPGRKAHQCTECGDCLPRCPENLAIPGLLYNAHEALNQRNIRRLWE